MEKIVVRPCIESDIPLILEFIKKKAAFDISMSAFSGEVQTTEKAIRETLFGAQPYAQALFAEANGFPIGFALYYFRYSSFKGRPQLWLDDLFVDDNIRSKGAGTLLMSYLAKIAIKNQCTHISWTANANNTRGIQFYERLGAKIIEQKEKRLTFQMEKQIFQELDNKSA